MSQKLRWSLSMPPRDFDLGQMIGQIEMKIDGLVRLLSERDANWHARHAENLARMDTIEHDLVRLKEFRTRAIVMGSGALLAVDQVMQHFPVIIHFIASSL